MYTFADRILDKVTAFLAKPENGPFGCKSIKNPENSRGTTPKREVLRRQGHIVTLWQQWG
jgi:hypothetical protein